MSGKQRNEGEGNRTAARQYNQATTEFAKSGKVDPAARKAEKALKSSEADELQQAEAAGRKPAEQTLREQGKGQH